MDLQVCSGNAERMLRVAGFQQAFSRFSFPLASCEREERAVGYTNDKGEFNGPGFVIKRCATLNSRWRSSATWKKGSKGERKVIRKVGSSQAAQKQLRNQRTSRTETENGEIEPLQAPEKAVKGECYSWTLGNISVVGSQ